MTAETVMTMTYQAMKIALAMAGPLLLVTLVVAWSSAFSRPPRRSTR